MLEQTAPTESELSSRRGLMTAGLALLGGALTVEALAQSVPPPDPSTNWRTAELRLLRRISYGVTPEDALSARQLGFSRLLETQFTVAEAASVESTVRARWPRMSQTARQLAQYNDDWQTAHDCKLMTLHRRCYGKRQLFEKMVEFWHDHFSIHADKVGGWLLVPYDRDVIRRNAFGKFPDLLMATAKSAAMMVYLDNAQSYAGNPNQNYAREFMELHTMGAGSGYTQDDVEALSKMLTGWSYQWDDTKPNHGEFLFDAEAHEAGPKVFMGQTYNQGGIQEGEAAIRFIANHPATANFIARKLTRYLLRYDAPATVVQRVAQVYRSTGGDIKAMIRAVLTQQLVMIAPAKYKRPSHLVLSMLRSMKANVADWNSVYWGYLYQVGHAPFDWAPPNGYPDAAEYWTGLILPRWNLSLGLGGGWWDGTGINIATLIQGLTTTAQVVSKINTMFFAGEMPTQDQAELRAYLANRGIDEWSIREAFGLTMASHSFQWF
ncbi:MAG: DUF1800 domain-containing protein [Armatimonadetes bacterium]|nr:DUF1800 domain-containing protein [Armatimonadota bacterium]